MSWLLKKWNDSFAEEVLRPMTRAEIDNATEYLREHNYPKPEDCPGKKCPDFRPACSLGVCKVAVGMCGDF